MQCDEFSRRSLSVYLCALGERFFFPLRRDIALRELIQNIFQTKIFFGFLVKGPPFLDVITNIKQRGGLLVTTTMAIHCEEPVISAFLLTVHFRNSKNFYMSKFCYGQIE